MGSKMIVHRVGVETERQRVSAFNRSFQPLECLLDFAQPKKDPCEAGWRNITGVSRDHQFGQ
jgi:hypothetical protein